MRDLNTPGAWADEVEEAEDRKEPPPPPLSSLKFLPIAHPSLPKRPPPTTAEATRAAAAAKEKARLIGEYLRKRSPLDTRSTTHFNKDMERIAREPQRDWTSVLAKEKLDAETRLEKAKAREAEWRDRKELEEAADRERSRTRTQGQPKATVIQAPTHTSEVEKTRSSRWLIGGIPPLEKLGTGQTGHRKTFMADWNSHGNADIRAVDVSTRKAHQGVLFLTLAHSEALPPRIIKNVIAHTLEVVLGCPNIRINHEEDEVEMVIPGMHRPNHETPHNRAHNMAKALDLVLGVLPARWLKRAGGLDLKFSVPRTSLEALGAPVPPKVGKLEAHVYQRKGNVATYNTEGQTHTHHSATPVPEQWAPKCLNCQEKGHAPRPKLKRGYPGIGEARTGEEARSPLG